MKFRVTIGDGIDLIVEADKEVEAVRKAKSVKDAINAKRLNDKQYLSRVINKYTYEDLKEVDDPVDDIVVTNDPNDDTAGVRVKATNEQFKNASGYTLLNNFERYN